MVGSNPSVVRVEKPTSLEFVEFELPELPDCFSLSVLL